MEVELSRPELVTSLIAALSAGDCSCTLLGRGRLAVSHDHAADAWEARVELTFFLRAWQREHGPVDVRVAY
jgi:hypothetical protein